MKRYTPTMLTALGLILGSYGSSFAQDDSSDGDSQIVEEQVIVTGTYIPRQTGHESARYPNHGNLALPVPGRHCGR